MKTEAEIQDEVFTRCAGQYDENVALRLANANLRTLLDVAESVIAGAAK